MKKYILVLLFVLLAVASPTFAIAPGAFPPNPFIPSRTPGDLGPIYQVQNAAQMGQMMADMDGMFAVDPSYFDDAANAYAQVLWLCEYMESGPTTYPVRNMYLAVSQFQFRAESEWINGDNASLGADRAYYAILTILQGLGGNP